MASKILGHFATGTSLNQQNVLEHFVTGSS